MAQLKDLIVNGPSRFIGDVYATTFTGNLAGNANTATSATNAGTVAGLSVHSGRNNEANKIVRTDGNGYLQVGYINSSSGHEKNASSPTYVWGSNSSDSYLRSYQTSRLSVNYATSSGSCSGNAATATKARYLQADNDAASPGGALLRSGSRRADTSPSGDTWIFWDELGGTSSYWGIRHNQANNSIGFCGAGSETSNISLETGKITSKGFILTGSSSSYVLLGNGGHAAISGLSVNYANSSGSCSGNAATATNADTLDGYHASNLVKFYLSPMTGGAPADSATSWFVNTMPAGTGAIVYNVPGSEKTIIAGKSTGAYGHMLQLNYDDNYLRILRYYAGKWKTSDWEKVSAGYADSAGNADTLDGYHASQVLTADYSTTVDLNEISAPSIYRLSTQNPNLPSSIFNYGNLLTVKYLSTDTAWQLIGSYSSDALWFRRGTWKADGTGTIRTNAWKVIAFTDSNVASATKLQNSRTLWGQSFDGTGNVSGEMSDVEVINFADNWMKIGIVRNSSNVKDLVIQSEEAYPISISSGGLKLRISARDLNWGNNIIYHSGNCNFPTTPWYCSNLYAENSVSTIKGEFRYIEFSKTNSYSNNGGYIDFHFNGSTADYTSRIIEGLSGQLTVTGKLRIGLNDATSTDYAFYVNGDGYFVDNVITEGDFSSRGDAIIDGHAKVNSLKASNICIECDNSGNSAGHTSEINNYSRPLYIQYSTSNNCCICYGGGNVGIGITSPTYKLHVSGDARIDGTISCIKLSQTSDIKYKTNIKQIEYEEALKIIENLNPVTWDWNENTIATGSSSGFVAQEAEEFIPNAISRDNENNLSLDYTQLHSYEIKVIQEQQKEIIKLKEKLKILEKLIS